MKETLVILAVVVLCVALLFGCYAAIDKPTCEAKTKDIGLPHRWSFWGGCQVQENDKWIPLDNWRYISK